MIALNRALARLLSTVLRRSLIDQQPRGDGPWLLCRADAEGMLWYAESGLIGVCYRAPGRPPPGTLVFRTSVLDVVGGRGDEPVVLEPVNSHKGRARWHDANVPRVHEFDLCPPGTVPKVPQWPAMWTPLPPNFLRAFDDAAQTAALESTRFALSRVQLHGEAGQIVATDSKQALLQSGFSFPWKDIVQVPNLRAFGLRELAQESAIRIGRTDKSIVIQVGPWTFFLGMDIEGRVPPVHEIIPRPKSITCRAQIDLDDLAFLGQALPKLPGRKDELAAVTLDLNRIVTVRFRAADNEPITEIELARSQVEGMAMCLAVHRAFLERVVKLRLPEIQVVDSNRPIVFRDKLRMYLALTLAPDFIIASSDNALRISSATDRTGTPADIPSELESVTKPEPLTQRRIPTMATRANNHHAPHDNSNNGNGHGTTENGNGQASHGPTIVELLAEVEQLRAVLHDATNRLNHLHNALKQYRRQGKAMQAAMQSLRQINLGD
jgi:hypothetical protein